MACVAHELFQDVELECSDLHRLAVAEHGASAWIESHAVHLHAPAIRFHLRAPQDCFHPRRKLAGIKWLWKIIIGAKLQAHNAVHILAARGKHEHRNPATGAEALENFKTVHARQHDIQDNQVIAALLRLFQSLSAFIHAVNTVTLALQKLLEQRAQFSVVIDDQQAHNITISPAHQSPAARFQSAGSPEEVWPIPPAYPSEPETSHNASGSPSSISADGTPAQPRAVPWDTNRRWEETPVLAGTVFR